MTKETKYSFDDYKKDALTRPRDAAWTNWAKFEKVGDKVQGFIRDVFFRPAQAQYQDQRGLTLEQADGVLINVAIKRLDFVLAGTDNLRIGDPLTIELTELKPNKGLSATKIFSYYGKNLPENTGKTVRELDNEDRLIGGTGEPEVEDEAIKADVKNFDKPEDIPFEG